MEKSGYQKALKVLCIIEIVLAALALVSSVFLGGVGILGLAASDAPEMSVVQGTVDGVAISGTVAAGILSIVAVVIAVICILDIVIAALGIRGANDPSKIKPFYWLVVIGIVIQVICTWFAFMNGGDVTVGFSVIYNFILLFLATKIKQQAGL